MNKVQRSSDKDLANHRIKKCLDSFVMTFVVCHNCEQVMEIDEALKSTSRDLMKMNHIILNLLNVRLPNPTNSDDRFIGKEDYKKKL